MLSCESNVKACALLYRRTLKVTVPRIHRPQPGGWGRCCCGLPVRTANPYCACAGCRVAMLYPSVLTCVDAYRARQKHATRFAWVILDAETGHPNHRRGQIQGRWSQQVSRCRAEGGHGGKIPAQSWAWAWSRAWAQGQEAQGRQPHGALACCGTVHRAACAPAREGRPYQFTLPPHALFIPLLHQLSPFPWLDSHTWTP